jgi:hypothetical protein
MLTDEDEFAVICKVCGAFQHRVCGWLKTSPLLRCANCSSLARVDGPAALEAANRAEQNGDPEGRINARWPRRALRRSFGNA